MILGRCNYPFMSSFTLYKYEMSNKVNVANVVKSLLLVATSLHMQKQTERI